MRAEPFVAGEPPFAVLEVRGGLDRADVRAAGALGHELRALPHGGDIAGQHLGQQIILQLLIGELADQMDRCVGDADRAHQAELGLHEQILQCVLGNSRQRTVHAKRAGAMAHEVEPEIAEGDIFHLAVGGVIVDPVLVASEAVARMKHRRMLVGDARELVEPAAGKLAHPIEMRFQLRKIMTCQIKRQQVAQAPVDRIEVLSRAVGRKQGGTAVGIGRKRWAGKRRVHGGLASCRGRQRAAAQLPNQAVSCAARLFHPRRSGVIKICATKPVYGTVTGPSSGLYAARYGRILDAAATSAARAREISLNATKPSEPFNQIKNSAVSKGRSMHRLRPLIVLLAVALTSCGEKPQQQAAAAPPVTVAQPVKRTVTDWDEFTGRFEAIEEVQVRARVGGYVTSVEFKDGDMVHKGDLLYVIDSRPFEAVAAQADGQLSDARAKSELAKRDLERGLALVQTSAVSEQLVDQRRQALQAAHAAETVAEGALKAAQLNIEFTHVLAPITGRVSRHLVSAGNLVQGSDTGTSTLLTTIVTVDPIYVYFDVDEATYLKNNKLWFEGKRPSSRDTPNPVQVTLTGETKATHEGHMDFLDNRLDVSTGTLRSRAVVLNHDLSILPGQFGRVRLLGSSPYEALLVPDTAIATDQSRKIVFVVKDDDTVEARAVELGPLDEGLRVIHTGLKGEDKVIIDGIQRARVGAKVAPHVAQIGNGKS